jgi:hypothetical protein
MTRKLWVATVFCLGCLGDSVINVSTSTGAYTLRTVNGSSLPFTIAGTNGSQTVILDDVIGLFEGNVYSETEHSRVTADGKTTDQTTMTGGRYGYLGNSITLVDNATNAQRTGLIDGNTLTIADAGIIRVFKK